MSLMLHVNVTTSRYLSRSFRPQRPRCRCRRGSGWPDESSPKAAGCSYRPAKIVPNKKTDFCNGQNGLKKKVGFQWEQNTWHLEAHEPSPLRGTIWGWKRYILLGQIISYEVVNRSNWPVSHLVIISVLENQESIKGLRAAMMYLLQVVILRQNGLDSSDFTAKSNALAMLYDRSWQTIPR